MVTNGYTMSEKRKFDVFDKMVEDDLAKHENNRKETFHAVNDDLAQKTGYPAYKSYQSYKNARSRNRKRT